MIRPSRAFYRPGETVRFDVAGHYEATIWHLADKVAAMSGSDLLEWTPPSAVRRGYRLRVQTESGEHWTAFDVLDRWTDAPRYGFLFDFRPERAPEDLEFLLAHHVNGIQFYDWMYRHDTLLPPTVDFVDPLGRELSLATTRRLIDIAHSHGMAAMPYAAIYAASPEFARQHPEWGLYDQQGTLYDFASGFLKIMNPASGWRAYLVGECTNLLNELPFDGIHLDQYGEPLTGYDDDGAEVDLPSALKGTIASLREAVPQDKALLFNLVHNWPLDAIAAAPVDFLYCEIWPPRTTFKDLGDITKMNWLASGGRTPVVAVYINPTHEQTVKMVECVILASGGYHIVHGEDGLYLSNPYFPESTRLPQPTAEYLQRAASFAVAYEELLAFASPYTAEVEVSSDVWPISRQTDTHLVINLLNVSPQDRWDQPLNAAEERSDVEVNVRLAESADCIWYVTPDDPKPPRYLDFKFDRGQLQFTVPVVQTWTLICVQTVKG